MAYASIATDSVTVNREDGSTITFDFELFEDGGSSQNWDMNIVEDVAYIIGSQSQDPFKPIVPSQIQFSIRDENERIAQRMKGADITDFAITIHEDNGQIFQGFIMSKYNSWRLYKETPVVDMVAMDILGYLQHVLHSDHYINSIFTLDEWIDFLINIPVSTARSRKYYFRKTHENLNTSQFLPSKYRIDADNVQHDLKYTERFAFNALQRICYTFGFQLFVQDDTVYIMDRKERIVNASGAQEYNTTGNNVSTVDLRKTLDKTNIIQWPEGSQGYAYSMARLIYKFNGRNTNRYLTNDGFDNNLNGWDTVSAQHQNSHTGTAKTGYAQLYSEDTSEIEQVHVADVIEGDNIDVEVDFDIEHDGTTPPSNKDVDHRYLEVKFVSDVNGGTDYWLTDNGNWVTSRSLWDFTINYSTTKNVAEFYNTTVSIASNNPIPTGEAGHIVVKGIFNTVIDGDSSATWSFLQSYWFNYIRVDITFDGTTRTQKEYTAETPIDGEDTLEITLGVGDMDPYSSITNMEYDNSGTWEPTIDWDSAAADDVYLQKQVAKSYAAQAYKTMQGLRARFRDLEDIKFWHTLRVDTTGNGTPDTKYIPTYWKRMLFSGFVEIEAAVGAYDESNISESVDYILP